jgi:hypothetical protein
VPRPADGMSHMRCRCGCGIHSYVLKSLSD